MTLKKPGRENWVPDDNVSNCFMCFSEFGMLRRRHHCRACGNIFCFACSSKRIYYTPGTRANEPGYIQKQKRVCTACFNHISEAWRDAASVRKNAEIARREAERFRNEALALRSAKEALEIQLDSAASPRGAGAPPPEESEVSSVEEALEIQLDSARSPCGADAPPPDTSEAPATPVEANEPLEIQLDAERAPHGGVAPPPDEIEALEVQPDDMRAPRGGAPPPDKSEAPATPPPPDKLDIEVGLHASDGEIRTLYDRIALFRRRVADMERELEEAHRRKSPPPSPQPESEPTPRGGPGVYLIFEVIQYGTLSVVWSKGHVEGALAYGEPGIRVPEFKYARGGKCELYRELACNKHNFYIGWTMFSQICRQFRCTVTVFGKSDQSVPVPITLWLHSKENGVQKILPDEAFTTDGVDVITATHRDNNDLLVSRMDRRTFVEKSRGIGHFVAFDAGR